MKSVYNLTREEWERNANTHTWIKTNKGSTSKPHLEIRCASCGWIKVFNGFSHMTTDCLEYKMDQALE